MSSSVFLISSFKLWTLSIHWPRLNWCRSIKWIWKPSRISNVVSLPTFFTRRKLHWCFFLGKIISNYPININLITDHSNALKKSIGISLKRVGFPKEQLIWARIQINHLFWISSFFHLNYLFFLTLSLFRWEWQALLKGFQERWFLGIPKTNQSKRSLNFSGSSLLRKQKFKQPHQINWYQNNKKIKNKCRSTNNNIFRFWRRLPFLTHVIQKTTILNRCHQDKKFMQNKNKDMILNDFITTLYTYISCNNINNQKFMLNLTKLNHFILR